ncbi:MAG: XRE family transcriptional regulator [Candidatus Krumholzibacteria bacterium]|nr:XRE family transcriptional regulator [Candidatus Krumholzibacteria bacterium]
MIDKPRLGKRIKQVRESKHLTLKNIEAAARISATHISEIERGKTSPTLGALIRIARALGKDPAYFIEEEDLSETSIVTVENRIQESIANAAGTIERLTSSIPGGRLQGCIVRLNAGRAYHDEAHSHHGDEAIIVLSGQVLFEIAGEEHLIETGDSISYGGRQPHSFANASAHEPAELMWVCTERGVS